jgi:hypothetical protein
MNGVGVLVSQSAAIIPPHPVKLGGRDVEGAVVCVFHAHCGDRMVLIEPPLDTPAFRRGDGCCRLGSAAGRQIEKTIGQFYGKRVSRNQYSP